MNKRLMICTMILCAAPSVYAAQVYKWTDAQGRVHYGDKPAQGSHKIKVNAAPSDTQLQKEKDKTDPQKVKRAEECKRSKEQLVTYQSAAKLIEKDALGNEKEYSDKERAKLLDLTQQRIKSSCEPVPEAVPKPE